MKYAIGKWSAPTKGITVDAGSEREARHVARDWIGGEPVFVVAVEDYAPPASRVSSRPPSLPGVPLDVAACLSRARDSSKKAQEIIDGAYREVGTSLERVVLKAAGGGK